MPVSDEFLSPPTPTPLFLNIEHRIHLFMHCILCLLRRVSARHILFTNGDLSLCTAKCRQRKNDVMDGNLDVNST